MIKEYVRNEKKKGSEVPSFYGLRHWRSLILLLKIYDDGG